jgi:integral membrane sensor domain MASE1
VVFVSFLGWLVFLQGVSVVDRVCGVVVGLSVLVMGGIFFGDVVFIFVLWWLGDVYFVCG